MRAYARGRRSILLAVAFLAGTSPALSGEGVCGAGPQLTARRGKPAVEVILEWTGGSAPFQVFRSSSPVNVVDPSNLIGTVNGAPFADAASTLPGMVWFYTVASGSFDLTHVPPCPTPMNDQIVQGQVCLATGNCQSYRVAPYTRVPTDPGSGAWWTKPSFGAATIPVQANCTFSFDSDTGGIDSEATAMAAYLVPSTCNASYTESTCDTSLGMCPPCANGDCALPDISDAIAFTEIVRNCPSQPVVTFAGRQWAVKQSLSAAGPGPCRFCSDPECVWVDAEGLHLCITLPAPGEWRCAEVILAESLGYGTYCFESRDLDLPDACMVGAGFLYDPCDPINVEIDIEYARWGNAADACNSQYVVQPCSSCMGCGLDCDNHCQRVAVPKASSNLTHYIIWEPPGTVTFRTYRGQHCGESPSPADLLEEWTAPASVDVPTPGEENFRLNLWVSLPLQGRCAGHVPTQSHCITITDFTFVAP